MIDLTDIEQVRELQSNLRTTLDTPQGKEVMKFLDEVCGWYDFSQNETNTVLIQHGKRQVLATLKTLLHYNPDEVVAIATKENE
jgi:hypothetical protein